MLRIDLNEFVFSWLWQSRSRTQPRLSVVVFGRALACHPSIQLRGCTIRRLCVAFILHFVQASLCRCKTLHYAHCHPRPSDHSFEMGVVSQCFLHVVLVLAAVGSRFSCLYADFTYDDERVVQSNPIVSAAASAGSLLHEQTTQTTCDRSAPYNARRLFLCTDSAHVEAPTMCLLVAVEDDSIAPFSDLHCVA